MRTAHVIGEVGEALMQRGRSATRQLPDDWDEAEFNETASRLLALPHKLALAVALYMRLYNLDINLGTANRSRIHYLAGGFQPTQEGQIAVAVLGLASSREEQQQLFHALQEALQREGMGDGYRRLPKAPETRHSPLECPLCARPYDMPEKQAQWPSMVLYAAHEAKKGTDPSRLFENLERRTSPEDLEEKRCNSTYRAQKSVLMRCVAAGVPLLRQGKPRGKTDLERALKEARCS